MTADNIQRLIEVISECDEALQELRYKDLECTKLHAEAAALTAKAYALQVETEEARDRIQARRDSATNTMALLATRAMGEAQENGKQADELAKEAMKYLRDLDKGEG